MQPLPSNRVRLFETRQDKFKEKTRKRKLEDMAKESEQSGEIKEVEETKDVTNTKDVGDAGEQEATVSSGFRVCNKYKVKLCWNQEHVTSPTYFRSAFSQSEACCRMTILKS